MSVAALLAVVLATQVTPGPATACDGFGGPRAPSRDIYCVELVRSPTVPAGEGVLELALPGSPFGLGVLRDGRLTFEARLTLSDLPDPSTLGDYTTYVAWVAPPVMFPMRKLGEVSNGTNTLPAIDLNKFMVLISAERSADADERTGRIVLRALSTSWSSWWQGPVSSRTSGGRMVTPGRGIRCPHRFRCCLPSWSWHRTRGPISRR